MNNSQASNLYLEQLQLSNFKNYDQGSLSFSSGLNCFVGKNGMGKTNLLDAIYMLCLGKSHFMSTDQNLVREGTDFFRLVGNFWRRGEKEEIVVKYKLRGKKIFECNKIAYKRLSAHVGFLPLVLIAPDDIRLITEGSEERRRFMDFSLVQQDSQYMEELLRYNQLLEQRNALLKATENPQELNIDLLETYDRQLVGPAEYIFACRTRLLEQLYPIFQNYYGQICAQKETVELKYRSQLQQEPLSYLLQASRPKDLILQRTSKGIHKDDLDLEIKGLPLKQFASQGQLKSFLLALKLAQYELLRQTQELSPILLLDDIFDKLDADRVSQLLSLLAGHSFGQVFITDTQAERMSTVLDKAEWQSERKIFMVQEGQAKEI